MIIKSYLRAINWENLKEWKIELTYKTDFIRSLIEPIFFILPQILFGIAVVGGRESQELKKLTGNPDIITFISLGYIVMGFINTAIWAMGMTVRREQWYGTLEAVWVTPVPRWIFVLGMAFHSTVHQGLIILIQILLLHLILGLVLNTAAIFPSLILCGLMVLTLYGMGILIAGLTILFKEGWIISEILHSLLVLLTPLAYPLTVLPEFMRIMSLTLPTTYGITGIRHFLIGEKLPFSLWHCFFMLILMSVLWIAFGFLLFFTIEKYARKKGILGSY